jgi:hypothetical protein
MKVTERSRSTQLPKPDLETTRHVYRGTLIGLLHDSHVQYQEVLLVFDCPVSPNSKETCAYCLSVALYIRSIVFHIHLKHSVAVHVNLHNKGPLLTRSLIASMHTILIKA